MLTFSWLSLLLLFKLVLWLRVKAVSNAISPQLVNHHLLYTSCCIYIHEWMGWFLICNFPPLYETFFSPWKCWLQNVLKGMGCFACRARFLRPRQSAITQIVELRWARQAMKQGASGKCEQARICCTRISIFSKAAFHPPLIMMFQNHSTAMQAHMRDGIISSF